MIKQCPWNGPKDWSPLGTCPPGTIWDFVGEDLWNYIRRVRQTKEFKKQMKKFGIVAAIPLQTIVNYDLGESEFKAFGVSVSDEALQNGGEELEEAYDRLQDKIVKSEKLLTRKLPQDLPGWFNLMDANQHITLVYSEGEGEVPEDLYYDWNPGNFDV